MAAAITLNLAFLGYFKYRGFFVDSLDAATLTARCGLPPIG